jgi:CubicO group peptidase (beta-lactamase class C family)
MQITRRTFAAGALGAALSARLAAPAFAQGTPRLAAAVEAIRAHAEQHLRAFGLPGMIVGLTAPNGFQAVLDFGFANRDSRAPITPDTLFQIGSISKAMTATVIHQLASEGRLRLSDRVSAILPAVPLPRNNAITVQHLLDHTSGLADSAPMFAEGGLWTGFAPGAHWHYSNTGYDILGKIAEHAGRKPLAALMAERIFRPLGMTRSRGAIVAADRERYAQGYEPADMSMPFARGAPLAPAAWVVVTCGAGCVASTAADMIRWMRDVANAAAGRGGLGLSPVQAKAFTAHAVPSDSRAMRYGNGLMHVGGGGRSHLHHTGGMVSFSSSFHVDTATGIGAFASSTLSAFGEYRPRVLTQYAVAALGEALAGRPVPAPPSLDFPVADPGAFVGAYQSPNGAFEVRRGNPLTLVANGREAPLQPWSENLFRTTHPDYRAFSLMFARTGGAVVGAHWGSTSFVRQGAAMAIPRSDPALARLAGRYVNDSPWWVPAIVVERGGKLWLGTETPLVRAGPNSWRVGEESWTPERASFADFIDGRPQTFILSANPFQRHDV